MQFSRWTLAWIIAAVAIVLGFVLYHYRTAKPRPNVEQHAAQEIEKAKRR